MAEYLFGASGEPVGPDFSALSEHEQAEIRACIELFNASAAQIKHFTERVTELGRSGKDTLITLIDVDDPTGNGKLIADMLMPDHDWQQYRDQGAVPVARGIVPKEPFSGILAQLGYNVASRELANTDDLQVLVIHAGTVQLMNPTFPES